MNKIPGNKKQRKSKKSFMIKTPIKKVRHKKKQRRNLMLLRSKKESGEFPPIIT